MHRVDTHDEENLRIRTVTAVSSPRLVQVGIGKSFKFIVPRKRYSDNMPRVKNAE